MGVGTRLRTQVAVIRALAEQIDRLPLHGEGEAVHDQLIEEAARLGCLLLEQAGWLAASQHPDESGVFARDRPLLQEAEPRP
jgi:hypothetical protein